jgi:hypothetical protein
MTTRSNEGYFNQLGALSALQGGIPLPMHFPQGSGGPFHLVSFPTTYANYNFHNSQVQLGGQATPYFHPFNQGSYTSAYGDPMQGPYKNEHLNIINSLNQSKKEGQGHQQNQQGLPNFIPHIQSAESFGGNAAYNRSFNFS